MFKFLDFLHNTVAHPICGCVWALGDIATALGAKATGARLDRAGLWLHNLGYHVSNPVTHAQIAHHARSETHGA